jgi:hypothetical protein
VGKGGKEEKNFITASKGFRSFPMLASATKKEYFLFALAALRRQ